MSPAAVEMGAEVLCSNWREVHGANRWSWVDAAYRMHMMDSTPKQQTRSAWRMAGIYRHIAQRSTEVKARSEAMRLAVNWARRAEAMDPRCSRLYQAVSR